MTMFKAIAGVMRGAAAPPSAGFSFTGTFSTSSGSSPVTSSTHTVIGSGTARFSSVIGANIEYQKNAGSWTSITEGVTVALAAPDTLAVRLTSIVPATATFDIRDNSNMALVDAVVLERT